MKVSFRWCNPEHACNWSVKTNKILLEKKEISAFGFMILRNNNYGMNALPEEQAT